MNMKNIPVAGSARRFVSHFLLMIFNTLSVIIAPYEIAKPGGIRAMDSPVMNLFFLSQFVLAFAAARGIRYRERISSPEHVPKKG